MLTNFPSSYQQAYDWQWSEWKPYFEVLAETELSSETIEQWLQDWGTLGRMFWEVSARMRVATTVDTTDEEAEARFKNFMAAINPEVQKITFALNKKLVESGLAPEAIKIPMRNIEAQIRLYNEDNLPLFTKLSGLGIRYDKLSGAQTVEWEGKEVTLRQLSPVFKDTNREKRRQAWVLSQERVYQDRDAYNELWREYMETRKQIYQNAGFNNYREYAWLDRNRFDYTPEEAIAFTEAIAETVVPVATHLREKDRELLGYEAMHPWDISVDPQGREPLKPYETIAEFIDTTEAVFTRVDPELGGQFQTMKEDNLLDLENRKGKGPGGYCTYFPVVERPFIFMNAVGLDEDVRTLLHEAGHAFHGFARSNLKYLMQHSSPMEFNEVASMAMELLATPYLTKEKGGYFSESEAARFQIDHLRGIINFWPYMAVVVAFQHWIYSQHDDASNPDNCDAKWIELSERFIPGIDWNGYEQHKSNRWRQQLHIFRVPFYYVEYGLAQLGAVQVWANALKNQKTALAQYQDALALGGTVKLPELYATAGGKLAFDSETLGEAMALIEEKIAKLEAVN
jgi:oligoendopeptidase F